MTTTPNDIPSRIRAELAACIAEARKAGYTGTDAAYDYTAADLESVTDALGYLPTRQQWAEAGLPNVGGAHVADDAETMTTPSEPISYSYVVDGVHKRGSWDGDHVEALWHAVGALGGDSHIDDRYRYRDGDTYYVVSQESMIRLGAALLDGHPMSECYSIWCAETDAEEIDKSAVDGCGAPTCLHRRVIDGAGEYHLECDL